MRGRVVKGMAAVVLVAILGTGCATMEANPTTIASTKAECSAR